MTKKLNRTCTACGLQKPLSAFLHLSGTQGTRYGNICSTCRGTGITERSSPLHEEERSGTTSSARIGTKQRLEIEHEKQQRLQEQNQEHKEELKKRDQLAMDKSDKSNDIEKGEKQHRIDYIEAKKQSFLSYKSAKLPLTGQTILSQKKEGGISVQLNEKQQAQEAKQIEEAQIHEQQKTTLDLSGSPVIDPQSSVTSRNNPMFEKFKALIGDTPLTRSLSSFYNKQAQQKPATPEKSSLTAENKLDPGKRKR